MKLRRLRDLLILVLAAVFVSTHRNSGVRHEGDIGELAGVATSESRRGRHLGFDTYAYPGDELMRAWRAGGVPYEWVGYYLPSAPCHKGTSWGGKRETLAEMGWGVAVIYVGQQPWGEVSVPAAAAAAVAAPKPKAVRTAAATKTARKTARKAAAKSSRSSARTAASAKSARASAAARARRDKTAKTVKTAKAAKKPPTTCSRTFVNAARGTQEADDAIAKAAAEGFAPGTVVFLNIERMNRVPQAMRDYYRAWTARLLADGRYRPGFYAHKYNAQIVYDDVKAEYARAGVQSEPPFWIAGGRGFSPEREPHEVGHPFAKVWQGVLDVVQEWKGFKLPIDVNVAHVPSPSSHENAAD
jgi:guanyl-specific ribonuclease Sa